MPTELHERIKKLAQDYGTSVNEMVNIACEEFLRSGKIEALEHRIAAIEKEVDAIKLKNNCAKKSEKGGEMI